MTAILLLLALNANTDSLRHGLEVCGDRRMSKAIGWQQKGTCNGGIVIQSTMIAAVRSPLSPGVSKT